jgi:hypothetical protein
MATLNGGDGRLLFPTRSWNAERVSHPITILTPTFSATYRMKTKNVLRSAWLVARQYVESDSPYYLSKYVV